MARSQSGSGASGVTGAAPAGRGGGGKDLHCQHSGSQLFAAINVCMRNSCGCGSPSCAGQSRGERCVLKVFPGNLLLLQGEDKGCTADGKHRQLLWCSSCCWWEGTRCAWIFPAFLPSLPHKRLSSCLWRGLLCQLAAVRHCEPDWGRGDCAPGQGRLQLLLCAGPSSQLRTGCSQAANLP